MALLLGCDIKKCRFICVSCVWRVEAQSNLYFACIMSGLYVLQKNRICFICSCIMFFMIIEMDDDKENLHKLLHQHYKLGLKASETTQNINKIVGRRVLKERNTRKWFQQFRSGRENTDRKKGSGRPPTVNYRLLSKRIERNPQASPSEISINICSPRTTQRWLHKTGRKPRITKWIPHQLTEGQKRCDISDQLLKKQRRSSFLRRLITNDETWLYYDDSTRKIVWMRTGE